MLNLYITYRNNYLGIGSENADTTAIDNGSSGHIGEPSNNAGYIIIVVIIIILVVAAIVLAGLHYKRKLPESFYNLGGLIKGDKQWKPVLAKVLTHLRN